MEMFIDPETNEPFVDPETKEPLEQRILSRVMKMENISWYNEFAERLYKKIQGSQINGKIADFLKWRIKKQIKEIEMQSGFYFDVDADNDVKDYQDYLLVVQKDYKVRQKRLQTQIDKLEQELQFRKEQERIEQERIEQESLVEQERRNQEFQVRRHNTRKNDEKRKQMVLDSQRPFQDPKPSWYARFLPRRRNRMKPSAITSDDQLDNLRVPFQKGYEKTEVVALGGRRRKSKRRKSRKRKSVKRRKY
jgi:hypothetical protein